MQVQPGAADGERHDFEEKAEDDHEAAAQRRSDAKTAVAREPEVKASGAKAADPGGPGRNDAEVKTLRAKTSAVNARQGRTEAGPNELSGASEIKLPQTKVDDEATGGRATGSEQATTRTKAEVKGVDDWVGTADETRRVEAKPEVKAAEEKARVTEARARAEVKAADEKVRAVEGKVRLANADARAVEAKVRAEAGAKAKAQAEVQAAAQARPKAELAERAKIETEQAKAQAPASKARTETKAIEDKAKATEEKTRVPKVQGPVLVRKR